MLVFHVCEGETARWNASLRYAEYEGRKKG